MLNQSQINYLRNLPKLRSLNFVPDPLTVTYYLTSKCNLNCVYCEDFGARRNANASHAETETARHVLKLIRGVVDRLTLTGGEPLLHPQVLDIVKYAKETLQFDQVTMLTNGALLREHEDVLPYLDHIVISLDDIDPEFWVHIIDAPLSVATAIRENIEWLAARQKHFGLTLTLNTVITPQTISRIETLFDFVDQHNLSISFSPQAIKNWPAYDLLVSPEYHALLKRLKKRKQEGTDIVGSHAYLQTLMDFNPYQCYPTLAPRVESNGDLIYPCKPIKDENNMQGGVVNLMDFEHWQDAISTLVESYGPPPRACTSCFQQCYAESSLMQARPLTMLSEYLISPIARKIPLTSFTPG